jgi:DNA polymerase
VSDAGGPSGVTEWVRYLKEIGVREMQIPSERPQRDTADPPRTTRPGPARAKASPPPAGQSSLLSLNDEDAPADPGARLEQIRADLGECTRCKLHEKRTNIVFGVGSPRAQLMFVGEGPGADEDAQGEPFVGRAGRKLDEMIAAIGLKREDVYIANIIKCRPPQNRDPQPDEVDTCSPFLFEQIGAIRPRVIVALGSPAAKTLLNTRVGITKLRGTWHSYAGVPVMPTFHPAYLLRAYTPENRRKVWEDLKAARTRMDEVP